MQFGIDLVFLFVLIAAFFCCRKRTLFAAKAGFFSLLISFVVSFAVSGLVAGAVSERVVLPFVEKSVAAELAALDSAALQETAADTVSSLPIEEWLADQPEPFTALVEKYGCEVAPLEGLSPTALLHTLSTGPADALARSGLFTVLFLLTAWIARMVSKRLELNRPVEKKRSGGKTAVISVCAFLSALIIAETLALLLIWLVPYGVLDGVLLDGAAFEQTMIYRFSPVRLLTELIF